MANNVKKQLMIRSIPPFAINRRIELKESNLNDIIRDAAGLMAQIIGTCIETRIELDEASLPVLADAALMGETVVSFARNAVDAMPDGGKLTVTTNLVTPHNEPGHPLRRCLSGSCVFFSVTDTGSGMDAVTMKHMFEPYFTTKKGERRGLSLAVAHAIIREHNGCIKVSSVRGKGTEIKVYLPIFQQPAWQKEPLLLVDLSYGQTAAVLHAYRA